MTRVAGAALDAVPSSSPLIKHDRYHHHRGGDDDDDDDDDGLYPQCAPVLEACKMTRHSAHDLHILRTLPASKPIVLFTPAILAGLPTRPREGKAAAGAPGDTGLRDPFECFGRALHRYHRSVRQMPFLPQRRFTDTHEWLLQRAGAVVVVVSATPDGGGDRFPAAAQRRCLDAQVDFALSAQDMLDDPAVFPAGGARPPLVLFQCGDVPSECWPAAFHVNNIVTCGAYEPKMAVEMSSKLFTF